LSNRIHLYADDLLQFLGPTDELTYPPVAITTVASCTGRLYEDEKDTNVIARTESLNADALAAAVDIVVLSSERFDVADTVEVDLDDGTVHQTTIAAIDVDGITIELTDALPSASSKGNVIRRRVHPIGATKIEVVDGLQYELGDAVEIRQDDGTRHATTIANRHRTYIEVDDAITVAVTNGRRVARKLGADIAMTIFNSAGAAANTDDWGYQGIIANDHAGLRAGMRVRAEMELVDDDVNDTVALETIRAVVVGAG
jgi:hypothetical protein